MYIDHCLKVIFFYADLDHQGPYNDHQDRDHQDLLCDDLSYADLDHTDHRCYIRMYTDHCPMVIFIYADLDHQGPLMCPPRPACDHLSYADLDHPDHCCCYVRL